MPGPCCAAGSVTTRSRRRRRSALWLGCVGLPPRKSGPHRASVLQREDLKGWLPKIAGMTNAERAALPGVSGARAHQLVAGGVVAEAVMDLFDIESLEICPWALREGVILEKLDLL